MNTKEAYQLRNVALKEFKFRKHPTKKAARIALTRVLVAIENLIQAIADKRSNPPDPLQAFTHEGIAYRLQRWVDGEALYVIQEKWDESKYIFQHPDKVRKVRSEINEVAPEVIEILLPLAPLQKRK